MSVALVFFSFLTCTIFLLTFYDCSVNIWKGEYIWQFLLATVSWIISVSFFVEKNDYNGRLFLKFMVDFYSHFTYLALAGKMRKLRETYISLILKTLNL